MRRLPYILVLASVLFISPAHANNAKDSTLNQVVTVEREYQPEIEAAPMIHVKPSVLVIEVDPNPVIYSTYSTPLSIGYNLYPLRAARLSYAQSNPTKGMLSTALGHHNTFLDFNYKLNEINNTTANIYAKHNAYWGSNTLSHTKIGGNGYYNFKNSKLYFEVEGGNSAYSIVGQEKLQALSHALANVGWCSNSEKNLQYHIQAGYKVFFAPGLMEHQIRSLANISWKEAQHEGGVKIQAQNNLYTYSQNLGAIHNIRIEPFYKLEEKKVKLHVGVNLDLNIGTEQFLSATENISFAPSPNIQFEWKIIPEKVNLHTQIQGYYAKGSIDESMHLNRYFTIAEIATKREAKTYTPVDANLGLIIHPLRTMLIDIYGGYALYMNDYTMVANQANNGINYTYRLENYQRGVVGAKLHYHYRDIVNINAGGNYYFWKNLTSKAAVYDRPDWDASIRVDVNIDQKWSIYSDNHLEGSRMALVNSQDEKLPMVIDLNVGAEYDINRWLNVYVQIGNYLHRQNPIYYGYNTQGCHFLAGFKYVF